MNIVQACILGLFQGIAEFLPISSSGHLIVFKDLMGLADVPVLFDVMLHAATLLSIIVVFRKRIGAICVSVWHYVRRAQGESDTDNLALIVPAIAATVVTACIGLALDKLDFAGTPKIVSAMFIVTGCLLIVSSRFQNGSRRYRDMSLKHGLGIGLAQGIGVLPGISRSGITITGGLMSGLRREEAGEFAFLLAIPAILGALILKLKDISALSHSVSALSLGAAALTAFVSGIGALLLLMPLVKKGRIAWFAAYLIPLGIAGLFFL